MSYFLFNRSIDSFPEVILLYQLLKSIIDDIRVEFRESHHATIEIVLNFDSLPLINFIWESTAKLSNSQKKNNPNRVIIPSISI